MNYVYEDKNTGKLFCKKDDYYMIYIDLVIPKKL